MSKLKQIFEEKHFKYFSYILLAILMIIFFWFLGRFFNVNGFLETIELKTLDFRFNLTQRIIKPNPDVVILSIDDASLEVLEDKYGRWPWSRDIYSEAVEYLESQGVDAIAFDLMFIGHQKGFESKDRELAKTIARYNNVYASMNFDEREEKNPPVLPEALKVNVENQSSTIDFSSSTFANCRLILDEILKLTPNIGIINLKRDEDGISRQCSLFDIYQGNFYPYLAFKVAYNYLKKHENLNTDKFVINKDNQLLLGNRKIQLGNNGKMLLNWYGPNQTYTYIPFWRAIKSAESLKKGQNPGIPVGYFKNKVVFVGTTALALFDIKSVPLSSVYPGVEIQATAFNNILDNNSVKRVDKVTDILICFLLCVIIGISVVKLRSTLASSFATLIIAALYILIVSILFQNFFVWVGIVNQIMVIALTFTFTYVIKYLMKSRDFEYTYKLATTDGLTNLHNHRYFQEHLANSIERAKRYKANFSLLLVDIDFFKKFNDTYGHQAGDAVLRQVADTLKKSVRTLDLVARYGGEEMAIILDNADIEEALGIADKICKAVALKPFKLSDSVERHVTISLGVATYPRHGQTPTELIEFADKGLYRAKENGRNQVGSIEDYTVSDQIII